MPPRDLALEAPWYFILVYLVVGPFFGGVLLAVVGVQWELPGPVARRNQSHALGFFLNPAP